MNIEEIKRSVDYIKSRNLNSTEAIEYLQNVPLNSDEKNVVYFYCFPRPLADYGLPPRIQDYRTKHGVSSLGNECEIAFLVEACQTEQYGRFMKHLMHAFGDPENVHPVSGGAEADICCICGKELRKISPVEIGVIGDSHSLSYGSVDSTSNICIDCLGRLIETMEIMEKLDPSFLNWVKRYQTGLSNIKPI